MTAPLSTEQLAEAADITYRQIDYWKRKGVIAPHGDAYPGPGRHLEWAPDLVHVCRVLGRIQRATADARGSGGLSHTILVDIVDAVRHGRRRLVLGEGVKITW